MDKMKQAHQKWAEAYQKWNKTYQEVLPHKET